METSLAFKQGLQGQRERLVRDGIKPADLERFAGLLVSAETQSTLQRYDRTLPSTYLDA